MTKFLTVVAPKPWTDFGDTWNM